nr:hypothetical protein [uncultured Rhodopila sp.]
MKPNPLHHPMRLLLIVMLMTQAGCDVWGRYRHGSAGHDETMWRPTGVPEANLDAMVAHPGDLIAGRGTATSDGQSGANAVERLRHGHVTPLPASSISKIGDSGSAPAPGGN